MNFRDGQNSKKSNKQKNGHCWCWSLLPFVGLCGHCNASAYLWLRFGSCSFWLPRARLGAINSKTSAKKGHPHQRSFRWNQNSKNQTKKQLVMCLFVFAILNFPDGHSRVLHEESTVLGIGGFALKMTRKEMKRTWQGKWNNMKGTEKTWLDMWANKLNEMERQRQSAKTITQKLEPVIS